MSSLLQFVVGTWIDRESLSGDISISRLALWDTLQSPCLNLTLSVITDNDNLLRGFSLFHHTLGDKAVGECGHVFDELVAVITTCDYVYE